MIWDLTIQIIFRNQIPFGSIGSNPVDCAILKYLNPYKSLQVQRPVIQSTNKEVNTTLSGLHGKCVTILSINVLQ